MSSITNLINSGQKMMKVIIVVECAITAIRNFLDDVKAKLDAYEQQNPTEG